MRWQTQTLAAFDESALPGLARLSGLVRTVQTPEFAGVTFHEVHARSALNRVPGSSVVPFNWTVNSIRGCAHRCTYCFARKTHEYLELGSGADFDSQLVVKINVADVLRRELGRPSWRRELVALGTNTDPYQRPEGRYRLMPGIISALAESGTPLSILTKGTLLRRDLPALAAAAERVPVSIGVSLALLDETVHRQVEPGTPTPAARLALIRAIRDAGLDCGVLVAPVLPYLTDDTESLDRLFGELAAAGASRVTVLALHLRPGSREWFLQNLARDRPDLVPRYRALYSRGAYLPRSYTDQLSGRVRPLLREHGFGGDGREQWRERHHPVAAAPAEPALF